MTKEKQYTGTLTLKDFKFEYRCTFSGDNWGSAMDAWFECAAHMWWKGMAIPSEWEYRPGMTADPRESDTYLYAFFDECPEELLPIIGNLLFRYCRYLKFKKCDY